MRVNNTSNSNEPPREPLASLSHEPTEYRLRTSSSNEANLHQSRIGQTPEQANDSPRSGWTDTGAVLDNDKLEMIHAKLASHAQGESASARIMNLTGHDCRPYEPPVLTKPERPSVSSIYDALISQVLGTPKTIETGLGADVDAVINQSPTLVADLNTLIDQGYTIEVGPAGGGTYINRGEQRIVIEERQSPEVTTLSVAHEVGHGINSPATFAANDYNRNDFIELNTQESLRNEALATLYALDVRSEILSAGGPDIGSSGAQSAQYISLYTMLSFAPVNFQDDVRLAVIDKIADLIAFGESPSTDPSLTYDEYYRQGWAAVYDA